MGDKTIINSDNDKLMSDVDRKRIAEGLPKLSEDERRGLADAVKRAEMALNKGNEKIGELDALRNKATFEVTAFNKQHEKKMAGEPSVENFIKDVLNAPANTQTPSKTPSVASPIIKIIDKLILPPKPKSNGPASIK